MDSFSVKKGEKLNVAKLETAYKTKWSKEETAKRTLENIEAIMALQDRLYAERKQSLLIVLQAMDAGGKDGCIRKVFGPINQQGCSVSSFKAPTELEKSHDFLWRIHSQAPEKGMIRIFNRSHYEDVIITRVHNWITPRECEKRLAHIRNFESLLSDSGTKVVKFFLNISKDEQKERFQERLDMKEKNWKFALGDLEERKFWEAYMEQFSYVLSETSTKESPWYVVPSDKKGARDYIVSSVVRQVLEDMDPKYPAVDFDPKKIKIL